jgi:hypothetical protein
MDLPLGKGRRNSRGALQSFAAELAIKSDVWWRNRCELAQIVMKSSRKATSRLRKVADLPPSGISCGN